MSVAWNLVKQSAGAVAWGLFIAAAPFEFVFGGFILWLPLLLWRERSRARKYGFWPGAVCRLAVILSIFVAAVSFPKYDDAFVGPLSYENISLYELCGKLRREHGVSVSTYDESAFEEVISFSTTQAMSRRAIVTELAKATSREMRFSGCLNGSSFLSGVGGIYYLYSKQKSVTRTSSPTNCDPPSP